MDYAIDLDKPDSSVRMVGATAWNYGVRVFPTTIVIDKRGKVTFNSDPFINKPAKPVAKNSRAEGDRAVSQEERNAQFKAEVAREIEKALDQKD
jgi:hypothetical protein